MKKKRSNASEHVNEKPVEPPVVEKPKEDPMECFTLRLFKHGDKLLFKMFQCEIDPKINIAYKRFYKKNSIEIMDEVIFRAKNVDGVMSDINKYISKKKYTPVTIGSSKDDRNEYIGFADGNEQNQYNLLVRHINQKIKKQP